MKATASTGWVPVRFSTCQMVKATLLFVLAVVVLCITPMPAAVPYWLPWVAQIALVLALGHSLIEMTLRSPRAIIAFNLSEPGRDAFQPHQAGPSKSAPGVQLRLQLRLRGQPDEPIEAVVVAGSYVSTWYTSIPYRLPNDPWWRRFWPHVLPLWFDQLAPDDFRRLRVLLRWS